MRYDAAQVEYLAAEYVLGTLHGPARRRFERLISDRADVRFEVWRWERHLNCMASGLEPRKPRPHVWKNIRQRINSHERISASFSERWRGLWLALPAAIATAWLAVVFWPAAITDRVAIFANQDAATLWVIEADLDAALIRIEALNAPALADNSSYELWVLPDDGPPRSLGLLSVNTGTNESLLSTELLTLITNSDRLAISLEPEGGSPTDVPTGPVVYVAPLVSI